MVPKYLKKCEMECSKKTVYERLWIEFYLPLFIEKKVKGIQYVEQDYDEH